MGQSGAFSRAAKALHGICCQGHLLRPCNVFLPAAAASRTDITVPQEAQRHLGLEFSTLSIVKRKTQVAAFAKVLDPGPLAQLCADLFAAEAAAKASRAEARRTTALHAADANMSAKDMETAAAQAQADETKRLLLRQRLGLEWGPGIAHLADSRLKSLVEALAKGTTALVHVDTPSNEGQKDARTVNIDIGEDSVKGIVLGPARVAEPRLSSSGLLIAVNGVSSVLLSVGLVQSAHIDTVNALQGVLLPREALVRFRGSNWVYVKHGSDQFERRLVQEGVPEEAGLFVAQDFSAGDQVVSKGSMMLFAIEQNRASTQSAN
jgi:hypothetical protein